MSSIFGEILTFPQERGTEVRLKVHGDEFYSRHENLDGYTVVYDSDQGLYCYALLIKGEFISSGIDLEPDPTIFSTTPSQRVRRDSQPQV